MSKIDSEGLYEVPYHEPVDNIYMYTGGTYEVGFCNSAHRPAKAPAPLRAKGDLRPKTATHRGGSHLTSAEENVYETPVVADPSVQTQNNPRFRLNQIASFKCATVCLGVLCVLLLPAIIVLGVLYGLKSTEVVNAQSERDALSNYLARDLGWTRFGSSFYFLSTTFNFTPNTWYLSRQDCKQKNADLVIINSKEELEFLSNYQSKYAFWIGASYQLFEIWRWVDGTPVNQTYWVNLNAIKSVAFPGNVDLAFTLSCATQNPAFQHEQSWAQVNCNTLNTWICERVIS